ncbi:Nicotinate phosphoribosyltransferase [Erysiphe neolycopersici]|uniref:Nicotinate phosphoribosyltransferase n=1 Tax=Erysiphe neolycopersici TaxID=212602 RepID=A0A420HV20_9PEZI|nr:Nicotinate phosphoribosyltransferase [Erysiphe neolycopersici]
MEPNCSVPYSEGIISLLDNDIYKFTMHYAVLTHFPEVQVIYTMKNRTNHKKLSRVAFGWLEAQIMKLGNLSVSFEELQFLQSSIPNLSESYINFLQNYRLNPHEQITCSFIPDNEVNTSEDDMGEVELIVKGLWVETILYEIPLLALTSEAYFRFVDTDWSYDGQEERAYEKAMQLMKAGCVFSEFGTRRRRDYHTQALVLRGLLRAQKDGEEKSLPGKLSGTSNCHFAMRFGIPAEGTVGHEWFMGVAAISNDYEAATITALNYWMDCFDKDHLGYILTDTFGTPAFLRSFRLPSLRPTQEKFVESFNGVRQDSGDPVQFVKLMKDFYEREDIKSRKTIVFSDSLNVKSCLEYKEIANEAGFDCKFGIGTFLTNDFVNQKTGQKSAPLNIVIKLRSAGGNPAVKLSDSPTKNMGDQTTVEKVKKLLRYSQPEWKLGDEGKRWGS